jgi:hypothetical protein
VRCSQVKLDKFAEDASFGTQKQNIYIYISIEEWQEKTYLDFDPLGRGQLGLSIP